MKKKLIALIFIAILATVMYLISGYPKTEPGPCGFVPCPTTTVIPSVVTNNKYQCPKTEWIDCLPGPDKIKSECHPQYLKWAKENCPNFKGAAY